MKKQYVISILVRNPGAIGIFWPKIYRVSEDDEETARRKVFWIAQKAGFQTAGTTVIEVKDRRKK